MAEAARAVLLLVLLAAALTALAMSGAWWFEPARRLRRALRRSLGAVPEIEAVDPAGGRAAGLAIEAGGLAVLWDAGASGLIYGLQEIDGAELIVDGRVSARVMRGEARRTLDAITRDVEQVTLRFLFGDARHPDFELNLLDNLQASGARLADPLEALRGGRRWLAHVDAITRQARRPARAEPARRRDPPELTDQLDPEEPEQPALPLD